MTAVITTDSENRHTAKILIRDIAKRECGQRRLSEGPHVVRSHNSAPAVTFQATSTKPIPSNVLPFPGPIDHRAR